MPLWARLVFAVILLAVIIIPLQWPALVGLTGEDGWWPLLLFAPPVIVTWIGNEILMSRRKSDDSGS